MSSSCHSAGKPEWKVVLSSMICIAVTFLTRTILIWAKQYFPRALTSLRGQNMSGVFWKKLTPDHCVWWREKGREFRQVNESCAVLPHPGPENSWPFTSSITVAANKNPKHVAEVYLLCSWPPYAFLGASPSQDLQDGHLEAAVKAVLQAVFYWNTWQKYAEGKQGLSRDLQEHTLPWGHRSANSERWLEEEWLLLDRHLSTGGWQGLRQ